MFAETGFEIYESRELVAVPERVLTPGERDAEARRLHVGELMERVRDRYWMVENGGDANAIITFISQLDASLGPILNAHG